MTTTATERKIVTINLKNLESGAIVHTGWNLGRDVADDCGVNVSDYFDLRGEYLGADENGLEPTFDERAIKAK